MVRILRASGEGSTLVNNVSNATGMNSTNGTITNTSQGVVAVANAADLNTLAVAVNTILAALKAHGVVNSA